MFFFIGASSATIINVHPGTNSIHKAINTAKASDTLKLSAGTYHEYNINVDKKITIIGPTTTGTPTAVIDAQGNGRVFNIYPGVSMNLKYITIQNGQIYAGGGGIYNRGKLTLSRCRIQNNFASASGGGILNYDEGTCTVTNSIISGNTATENGGGICNGNYKTVSITDSTIQDNTAKLGGGIYNYGGICTVTNSIIKRNSASQSSYFSGGGISNDHGTLTVTGSTIQSNTATNGDGGGISNSQGTLTVTGSTIQSNTADNGGGISNFGGSKVTGSTIQSNTALYGGGIFSESGIMAVTGCDFRYNKAYAEGNAISIDYGSSDHVKAHFNRFDDPYGHCELRVLDPWCSIDASYNWWGSNAYPDKCVGGMDNIVSPWLVLKVSTSKNLIGKDLTSTINANLRYDSNGKYHNPLYGHVKNGIYVSFTTNKGTIKTNTLTKNGIATATLKGGAVSGVATVSAKLNNQILTKKVTIDSRSPKIRALYPLNRHINFSRTALIKILFTEKIKASRLYNYVRVKNLSTHRYVHITKTISGNTLYIKTTIIRSKNTWYQVTIPKWVVKDYAGNNLPSSCTFKFKTVK